MAALGVVVVAAGCGSAEHAGSTPASGRRRGASASPPAGFVAFGDPSEGFTIGVPSTWERVDTSSAGAAAQLQQLVARHPDLQSAYGDLSTLISTDIKFVGVDAASTGKDAANMNVIVRPQPGITDSDLPQLLNALKSDLAQSQITVASSTTTTLAGHKALEDTLAIPITDPSGTKSVDKELQDVVAANNDLYLITFGGTGNLYSTIASTFSLTAP